MAVDQAGKDRAAGVLDPLGLAVGRDDLVAPADRPDPAVANDDGGLLDGFGARPVEQPIGLDDNLHPA